MKKKMLGLWTLLFCLVAMLGSGTRVLAAQTVTISRMEVQNLETEILYGQQLNTSGISLLVTYSDKSTKVVKPDRISQVDTKKLGAQEITFYYQESTVKQTIYVMPNAVKNIRIADRTTKAVTIAWDKLEEAQKYEIFTSMEENGSYDLKATVTNNQYKFTDLTKGEIRYVKIRALGGDMTGGYTDPVRIALKPEQVQGVTVTQNSKNQIALTWNAVEGATGYLVYYRLSSAAGYTLASTVTKNSCTVTELSAGKDYYFQVYAYVGTEDNIGAASTAVLSGTAPAVPTISKVKGGDGRVKVYWKNCTGAESYRFYLSTQKDSGYMLAGDFKNGQYNIKALEGLTNGITYYVKVEAVRTVAGMELSTTSTVSSAKTKKAAATSTKAKLYKTKAKFKKSAAYKKYKTFSKLMVYNKSFIMPGMIKTNVGGFSATRMIPQSITFAGKYLLMSAYDYTKAQESVIYVMDKNTRKYLTTIVMPHTGHLGGIVYDGTNIWITHGKKLECFPFQVVENAVLSGGAYTELYSVTSVCTTSETVSYVSYYKNRLWAGAYSETKSKYLYGYTINDKTGVPTLTRTHKILMPNRTQGVAFTKDGKLIISRSCQTKKGRSGFMSELVTYKPTWNFSKTSIKKNKKKKTVKMPPMNEGIAISGSYLYVIYESCGFSECQARLDRIMAFKTKKITG